MKKYNRLLSYTILFATLFFVADIFGQPNALYSDLPVGKYAVGFTIITITDPSRVTEPEYNYLGEKNEQDRSRKVRLHIWYPANKNDTKKTLRFEDYCFNELQTSTGQQLSVAGKASQVNEIRSSMERWWGKIDPAAWNKLTATPMLAHPDAVPVKEKFPLLIGTLRPLSTSITNELLASNGYVVAMVYNESFSSFSNAALSLVPDMQFALNYLAGQSNADVSRLGVFGFSGSGFIPVLFSMFDYRVKALADIESGIYMDGLFEALSASNYYNPAKLRFPFLHIFSRDLSKQEKYINEFENKSRFSKRYRLLLNQPALHHWDFATEGYVSSALLQNRGPEQANIKRSFEIAGIYLLNFFNAELKLDPIAVKFLSGKAAIPQTASSLWDIATLQPIKTAPDKDEFEYIIRTKGIDEALNIVKSTLENDSSTNLLQGFMLNNLGYVFLRQGKYKEAIGVFKLNTELHPAEANFFDSLAEAYEATGDKEHMKTSAGQVIEILDKKTDLTVNDKNLKETAGKRLKN